MKIKTNIKAGGQPTCTKQGYTCPPPTQFS